MELVVGQFAWISRFSKFSTTQSLSGLLSETGLSIQIRLVRLLDSISGCSHSERGAIIACSKESFTTEHERAESISEFSTDSTRSQGYEHLNQRCP